MKFYASTTRAANVDVSIMHGGTEHYSHIHTPLAVPHNALLGLQGGTSDQYYHLSTTQYTIAIQAASNTQSGYLTGADWSIFNGKQAALSTDTGITISGTTISSRAIAQNSQSAAYTFVLSDAGKDIYHPSSDTTPRNWIIPANSSEPFDIGTMITITNGAAAGAITLVIISDTLYKAGSGTAGSVTIPAHGMVTMKKETATIWRWAGAIA